jgi:hypothetical protein
MNLSTADLRNYRTEFHEICGKGGQSHIFGGSKGVEITIESYGKLEICTLMLITSNWIMIET